MFNIGTIIFMIQLLLGEVAFLFTLPRRKYFVLRFVLALIVCVGLAMLFPSLPQGAHVALRSLVNFCRYFGLLCVTIASFWFCFDAPLYAIITFAVAGYAIQHFSNRVSNLLYLALPFFKEDISMQLSSIYRALVYSLPAILLLAAIFAIPCYKKRYVNTGDKRLSILAFLIVFSGMGITRVGDFLTDKGDSYVVLESLYGMLMSVVSLLIMFTLFRSIEKEREMVLTRQLLREQKEEYRAWKNSIDVINAKSHDLKHVLSVYKNGGSMSKEQVKELEDALRVYDSALHTGNPTLDVCLYERLILCDENKINFTFLADGRQLDFLCPEEIYSLFGNLLENAMNAVKGIAEEKRVISLSVRNDLNLVLIHCENYFDGDIAIVDGMPKRKEESLYHGFGTRSIAMIAEKHGGSVSFQKQGDVFMVDVSLVVPRCQKTE